MITPDNRRLLKINVRAEEQKSQVPEVKVSQASSDQRSKNEQSERVIPQSQSHNAEVTQAKNVAQVNEAKMVPANGAKTPGQKFDFLKTPSYFVEKVHSPVSTWARQQAVEPHVDDNSRQVDNEEIRKLRVAFFDAEEAQGGPKESKVVQLKKCSENSKSDKEPIYDRPKTPARPVSPEFFNKRLKRSEGQKPSESHVYAKVDMSAKKANRQSVASSSYEAVEFTSPQVSSAKPQLEDIHLAKSTKIDKLATPQQSSEPSYSNLNSTSGGKGRFISYGKQSDFLIGYSGGFWCFPKRYLFASAENMNFALFF